MGKDISEKKLMELKDLINWTSIICVCLCVILVAIQLTNEIKMKIHGKGKQLSKEMKYYAESGKWYFDHMKKLLTDYEADWIMKMATRIKDAGLTIEFVTIERDGTIKISLAPLVLEEGNDE